MTHDLFKKKLLNFFFKFYCNDSFAVQSVLKIEPMIHNFWFVGLVACFFLQNNHDKCDENHVFLTKTTFLTNAYNNLN